MKIQLLTLVLLVGFAGIACAQKAPIKFGQISKEDLLNNVYAPDTTAPAVILCDYGYFTYDRFQTVRILRIKILKKEGYIWANQSFNADIKDDIRGITYNLEGNEIVETKLRNESVFRTRIFENYYLTRVAMPNIKVGSVIDIQITFDGIPREWEFQQEIPVVHSELIIEQSPYITYNKNYFGYIPLSVNTSRRWVLQNAPAFKPEQYITSSKNYRARFEFDIEEVSIPSSSRTYTDKQGNTYRNDFRGNYKSYTKTWESVRDILYIKKSMDSWGWTYYMYDHFKLALESDSYLDETVKDMKSRFLNRDETIKVAFEYVKQIKWNKTNSFFADKIFLSSAYKDGEGNTADINLALVQLLCKLGLDAGPVIMSTRSNGRLSEDHPSINKLNYVIAAVFTENDTLLLDATEKNSPYYLLPMRALNGHGQFVDKKRTGWIPMDSHKKDKQMVVYTMSIEEDHSIKGKISYLKGDYAALEFRNEYENFNSDEEYILNFKKNTQGLKIISHKIDNLDSLYKPVNEEFDIEIKDGVSVIDSELYINPLLNEQIKENPFKVNKREYPIDFGYARDKTIIVNYVFPKGYMVVNLPENISMKLPGNTASFTCKSTVTEGKITVMYKFAINSSVFVQTEYADFREFYNQVISKEAEPIVLKKI